MHEKKFLKYDPNLWQEAPVKEVNTLQLFITNRCNLRCKGCFYQSRLGKGEISFSEYQEYVLNYKSEIDKLILLGGEPTLHQDLQRMISFNQAEGLRTTIYTNGTNLENLEGISLGGVGVRIGVHGVYSSEKPLVKVPQTSLPVTIVYMLDRDNFKELFDAAKIAEQDFNCSDFYISSIRDIAQTHNYWLDTINTIPLDEYFSIVQNFITRYDGKLNLHISKRGVIQSKFDNAVDKCRFGNIFPDASKIRCPLDISLNKRCKTLEFNKVQCNKDKKCILRKIVLKRNN